MWKRMERISEAEMEKIREAERGNKDKRIARKLRVLELQYRGKSVKEIAEMVGLCETQVYRLIEEYRRVGLEEYSRKKYGGNHRALSWEEEEEILSKFREQAAAGKVVRIQEIKAAFDERRGKDTGRAYIYELLKRHKWRKVMPRTSHPKKANEAEIEASKKLRA